MDNILKVTIDNGNEIEIVVLDIFKANYNGVEKEYIVYTISDSDEFIVSILNESDTSYSLDTIESEEELQYVENYLLELIKEDLD